MTIHASPPPAPPLPPETPLAMPVQALDRAPPRALGPRRDLAGTAIRAATLLVAALVAGFLVYEMHAVLTVSTITGVQIAMLGLFAVNITWIAFAFALATLGLLALLGARVFGGREPAPRAKPESRTAILLPTYNEDPARVFATAAATAEALADAGVADCFDLFVLSDTTDPDIWMAEEEAFLATRRERAPRAAIYYRRRPANIERKAGNIADWVRRFGGAYPHFVVFDADSLMTPRTLVRMAIAMERRPDLGLLQTVPVLTGRTSLFARLQQFASRIYGPVLAAGLATFARDSGNYWGHNAILRTRAFAQSAGLPHLKGPPPFGGHVLSHDFVEAALMRRAGWAVVIDPRLGGSFEESPPSLIDLAQRDRRWCQGNLQHARLVGARGLDWVSRLHFGMGIMAYLAAPFWLAFLVAGLLLALQAQFVRPEYFTGTFTLFPRWPVFDDTRAMWLFAATMAILFAPKVYGLVLALVTPAVRRGSGGGVRLTLGVLFESLVAALLAPVMMAIQSAAVAQIAMGRDAGWNPQRRDDGSVPLAEIARRHRWHTALGLALGAGAFAVSPEVLAWMSPAVIGLLLAIPLSAATARAMPRLARLGILATPEETRPHPMATRAAAMRTILADALGAPRPALRRLADVAPLAAFRHACAAPAPARFKPAAIDADLVVGLARIDAADTLDEAIESLARRETLALLASRAGIERVLEKALPAQASAA